MTQAARLEARLLTASELELVALTRPPEIERQRPCLQPRQAGEDLLVP